MPVYAGFMHGMGRGQGSLFGAVLRRRLLCKAEAAEDRLVRRLKAQRRAGQKVKRLRRIFRARR